MHPDDTPSRREFLAAAGFTGYSLIYLADPAATAAAPPPPPADPRARLEALAPRGQQQSLPHEPHLRLVQLDCDVLVAGGGMAGVCAAIAAARNGARVVLVQDRSRLGGNASSEVRMHIVGANAHRGRPGWREGGLLEEFRLDDAVNNPQRCWELWDLLLYDKVMREPNLTLLLDSVVFSARTREGRIEEVLVRSDKTEHLYRVRARVYCDCTGDSRLGLEAGADMRHGRESRAEHNEPLAPVRGDRETLGSSLLFTSQRHDRPMPFTPPPWARRVRKEQLRLRGIRAWEYGYWWIEWGGQLNTIADNERIRFELLGIVLGIWDYIKNSGNHPDSANWALSWVGTVPGKRESRRLLGDHVLTQQDLLGQNGDFPDAVAIGGWPMDDHPPSGFDRSDQPPATQIRIPEVYNIPLRSLYSRNVSNLMMAGRNLSASHVAFTSTRVMGTCSVAGQAVGTAAALCARHDLTPRQLAKNQQRLTELQQTLLRDDQSIKHRRNEDPADLARQARVRASGHLKGHEPEKVLDGFTRDIPGREIHRWTTDLNVAGAWLELSWQTPQVLRQVQLTFDTGFQRELTLTLQDSANKGVIRAPQPETVRDYTLRYRTSADGPWVRLLAVRGNYQRLNRHHFAPIKAQALRLDIAAAEDERARVFEVRCYA